MVWASLTVCCHHCCQTPKLRRMHQVHTWGCSALFNNCWFQLEWFTDWKHMDLMVKELVLHNINVCYSVQQTEFCLLADQRCHRLTVQALLPNCWLHCCPVHKGLSAASYTSLQGGLYQHTANPSNCCIWEYQWMLVPTCKEFRGEKVIPNSELYAIQVAVITHQKRAQSCCFVGCKNRSECFIQKIERQSRPCTFIKITQLMEGEVDLRGMVAGGTFTPK